MFEKEEIAIYIPFYQIYQSLMGFISDEKINILDHKNEIFENEAMKMFLADKMKDAEWYENIDEKRLDQIYLASSKIFHELILPLWDHRF